MSDNTTLKVGGSKSWNKKSVIFRKPSMERSPKGFFSVTRVFVVEFKLSENDSLKLKCVGNQTVAQIKENLLIELDESYPNYSLEGEIVLSYRLNGQVVEICDLDQTFQTLRVAQMWSKTGLKGTLYVSKKKEMSNEEKVFNIQLGSLMGMIWGSFQSISDDEFYTTRRKFTNVRRHSITGRNVLDYAMELSLNNRVPSQRVLAQLEDNKFTICINGKNKAKSEIFVHQDDSPPSIIRKFMQTISDQSKDDFGITLDTKPSSYVLKVCGIRDYMWGQSPIINFEYIRNCLAKKIDPQLCIQTPLSEEDDEILAAHDPWNIVDESTGMAEDHQELTIHGKDHTKIVAFSLWDMPMFFKIKIIGMDFLTITEDEVERSPQEIFIEAALYHGQFQLAKPVRTTRVAFNGDHRWYTWLQFDIRMRNIPKEARLSVRLIGVYKDKPVYVKSGIVESDEPDEQNLVLRWANMQLLNHRSVLRTGAYVFCMWPTPFNDDISFTTETGTTAPNLGSGNTKSVAKLYIELDTYRHPVAFPRDVWKEDDEGTGVVDIEEEPVHGSQDWKQLEDILKQDQLQVLGDNSKQLLFKYRWYCRKRPNSLPKLLQSVNPASVLSVGQMHRVVQKWPNISMEVAIELLDSHFVDERVRSLAVHTLRSLSNKQLMPFLLQLTQALKFESYHDSASARFLLTRALQSKRIGHYFYWFLRSEMDNSHVTHRYSLLLEAYLRGCGKKMLSELNNQSQALSCFKSITYQVTSKTKHSKSNEALKEELSKACLPSEFQAPYDPRITLGKLNPAKCKVMDSKKRPLWLEFENADPSVTESDKIIQIIFKQGDDLRQDMLTLQMLTVMGQLWEEEGLDLCLLPYGCMSTGLQVGVIQVVSNATTVAKIQRDYGGVIRGSFRDEILKKWLEHNNPHPENLRQAVRTFMLSCAGYCVATYVLGIGDRHNDNIMVKDNGNLFHIDFGHFLGNTKTFLGIQRERVPFVLTPDFVYVMGTESSEMFQLFKDTAVHAFLVIRRNAALFINLFHMMKSTGIPELTSVLILDKTEAEAKQHFLDEIAGVLKKNWTVQVNWLMHGLKHAGN